MIGRGKGGCYNSYNGVSLKKDSNENPLNKN